MLHPLGVVVVNVLADHLHKLFLAGESSAVIRFSLENTPEAIIFVKYVMNTRTMSEQSSLCSDFFCSQQLNRLFVQPYTPRL